MCDFRLAPGKILNKETSEVFDVAYHGRHEPHWPISLPGVYHVGATGCGYSYYDGQYWHSGYDGPKYNFIFQETDEQAYTRMGWLKTEYNGYPVWEVKYKEKNE